MGYSLVEVGNIPIAHLPCVERDSGMLIIKVVRISVQKHLQMFNADNLRVIGIVLYAKTYVW